MSIDSKSSNRWGPVRKKKTNWTPGGEEEFKLMRKSKSSVKREAAKICISFRAVFLSTSLGEQTVKIKMVCSILNSSTFTDDHAEAVRGKLSWRETRGRR